MIVLRFQVLRQLFDKLRLLLNLSFKVLEDLLSVVALGLLLDLLLLLIVLRGGRRGLHLYVQKPTVGVQARTALFFSRH